ncbi:M28 family peptidase [Hyalangium versicolor]|uniref:M28 family peptidase n=1 Tax=Hyalangium versicolor TaxID=2861190 RepID=UPI001CCCE2BD|nr:M28 family peptidase [Hyalangium versicolor]
MWIQERAAPEQNIRPLQRGAAPDGRQLREWVERLAIPRHLFANTSENAWVRDELAEAFERYGFSVQLQGRYQNVVAVPRTASTRPLTLISAHYDSVPDCPGADDNASGLAVMLECARVLSENRRGLAVGFISFNAEEDGLLGSRDFVTHGLPELHRPVRLTHVLEMIGFRASSVPQRLPLPWAPSRMKVPDFLGLLATGNSNATVDLAVNSAAAPRLRLLAAKTWGPLHRLLPDLRRSDHFPFWDAGIPAVLWTDTGNFRNPHYHQATDTPDTLDYTFMREAAELLCALVSQEEAR